MIQNANIFIIRHAEQQEEGVELNRRGRSRALAYAAFLAKYKNHNGHTFEFANLIACGDIAGKSIRPRQTLEPLSAHIEVPLDCQYTENAPLVTALNTSPKYSNCNTLICWRHKQIISLYESIAGPGLKKLPSSDFPSEWPGDVYGWIIRLAFNAAGELTDHSGYQNLRLMYDDANTDSGSN